MKIKPAATDLVEDEAFSVVGDVSASDHAGKWFRGSIFRNGAKTDVAFAVDPDNFGVVELALSKLKIVESFGNSGLQKCVVGYGRLDNINIYPMSSSSVDTLPGPYSEVRIGIYADDSQNHPNTVIETKSDQMAAMIKLSSVEFDRLLVNFRSNMFCRLYLEGAPIYKLDGQTCVVEVNKKHFVEKKTKFEFEPAINIPEANVANNDNAPVWDSKFVKFSALGNGFFSIYPSAAKSILLKKTFMVPFILSFITFYGLLHFAK